MTHCGKEKDTIALKEGSHPEMCREKENEQKREREREREREISTCKNKEYKKAKSFIWMF